MTWTTLHRAATATVVGTLFWLAKASSAVASPEPASTSWWVDPESCPAWTVPLARQIALACEATGRTCEVQPQASTSTRSIALHCDTSEHWTLEAHDASGKGLWHIEVRGTDDDRIRQAALWVAREGTVEVFRPDTATIVAPPPPKPMASAAPENRGGISMAARGLYQPKPPQTGATYSAGFGLRVLDSGTLLNGLPRAVQGFLALSGEHSVGNPEIRLLTLRLGVGGIWHVGGDVLGLIMETGVGYEQASIGYFSAPTERRPVAYVQGGFTLQPPVSRSFRPFATIAAGATGPDSDAGVPMVVAEIGATWIAW